VRDDFPKPVIEALGKRAAYICSNPDCRALTIAPSESDDTKWLYIGKAAHICAASVGGPRYKASMTPEERQSVSNGVFLCGNCADMIDKNGGLDFREELLQQWKADHERWVLANLNKQRSREASMTFQVTSIAQQGGITAGIVNVGHPRRKMNPDLGMRIIQHLPDKSRMIRIVGLLGNQESMSFAAQIRGFLIQAGYSVEGPSEAVFGRYIPPLEVFPQDYVINVGANEE
jgi:hypothetical protein